MRERTVEVAGGSLWYRTQGMGPALILMGGGPSNADTLEPLASRLAQDRTVVTYDRRGYARSHVDDRLPFDLNLDSEKDPGAALNAIAASVGVSRSRIAGGLAGPGSNPADVELFIRRDAPAIGAYHLDLDRLRPMGGRIVVAGSRDSRGFYPYQCAAELARQLETPLAELPGNHAGMIRHPTEFAARLRELLRSPAAQGAA